MIQVHRTTQQEGLLSEHGLKPRDCGCDLEVPNNLHSIQRILKACEWVTTWVNSLKVEAQEHIFSGVAEKCPGDMAGLIVLTRGAGLLSTMPTDPLTGSCAVSSTTVREKNPIDTSAPCCC
jgi:hypothetical protein